TVQERVITTVVVITMLWTT
nr:immunoglobulin heavy chain junction region [Mus musculus]